MTAAQQREIIKIHVCHFQGSIWLVPFLIKTTTVTPYTCSAGRATEGYRKDGAASENNNLVRYIWDEEGLAVSMRDSEYEGQPAQIFGDLQQALLKNWTEIPADHLQRTWWPASCGYLVAITWITGGIINTKLQLILWIMRKTINTVNLTQNQEDWSKFERVSNNKIKHQAV